jgi:hypothetical protein
MIKLKVTILTEPGDEEEYLTELESLCRDSEPPILIKADLTLYEYEGKIDFFFEPINLTDEVDYILGHAAALLKATRLDPEEVG